MHPATGSYSSLYLSICSPDIFVNFKWKVEDDLHGSDHFPIIITETGPSVHGRPRQWKLHKANWNFSQIRCEQITLVQMLCWNVMIVNLACC